MADDARVILVADLVDVLHVDAEALHEALVAQNVDRRLRGRQIEEGDLGVLGGIAERCGGPLADQFAGEQVVGGKGHVGAVERLQRRVERDDQQAGFTRLLHRGNDALGVGRGNQDALRAVGNAGLDGCHLAFGIAVDLAGIGLQRHAEFLRLGFGAFLHLDEEGVGVGLGDQAGADIGGGGRRREGHAERKGAKSGGNDRFLHRYPPKDKTGCAPLWEPSGRRWPCGSSASRPCFRA